MYIDEVREREGENWNIHTQPKQEQQINSINYREIYNIF